MNVQAAALKHGWRSGLEERNAAFLERHEVPFKYEEVVLRYVVPESQHKYTPDFVIKTRKTGKEIVVETKGRFMLADRKKHILLKKQFPDMDLRFVFSNAKAKLSKGAKSSYADWCEKHGFLYATKLIPEDWINE